MSMSTTNTAGTIQLITIRATRHNPVNVSSQRTRLHLMEMPRLARWRALATDRRVVDGALVVACLVLTALAVKGSWSILPRPVIAVAGVVGSAAQWFRRRQPHAATVAGAAAYALSGNPGPLLVGLYSGASYAPRRHVWALALVGWAGFAGWSWLDQGRVGPRPAGAPAPPSAVAVGAAGPHGLP